MFVFVNSWGSLLVVACSFRVISAVCYSVWRRTGTPVKGGLNVDTDKIIDMPSAYSLSRTWPKDWMNNRHLWIPLCCIEVDLYKWCALQKDFLTYSAIVKLTPKSSISELFVMIRKWFKTRLENLFQWYHNFVQNNIFRPNLLIASMST